MHEDKGPSVNLKNINFINKVEEYQEKARRRLLSQTQHVDSEASFRQQARTVAPNKSDKPIFEEDYFIKHVYMLKERMLEMFRSTEDKIPTNDKRIIEKEFHRELKELKRSLKEIKATRKTLFAENNEKYLQIDRINEELQKEETEQQRRIFVQRKTLVSRYGTGRQNTNTDLVKFVVEKEKAKKLREEKIKRKNDLKSEWERNKENIKVMEDKIDLIKSKLLFVKGILKEYYVNLLHQGTDTRGRGLIWIIQKLDKLGVRADQMMFPQFLAPLNPYIENYLEELAKKDKELRLLKKKCGKYRSGRPGVLSTRALQRTDTLFSRYVMGKASISDEYNSCWSTVKRELRNISYASSPNNRPSDLGQASATSMGSLQSKTFDFRSVLARGTTMAMGKLSGKAAEINCEKDVVRKLYEIQVLKKDQSQKLGKFFSNISVTARKMLLPRVTAALFGESSYEIEMIKYAQIYKSANAGGNAMNTQ